MRFEFSLRTAHKPSCRGREYSYVAHRCTFSSQDVVQIWVFHLNKGPSLRFRRVEKTSFTILRFSLALRLPPSIDAMFLISL